MYLQLISPKDGLCAPCHSGTPAVSCLLFLQLPTDLLQYGTRLQLLHVQVVGQFSGVMLENKAAPLFESLLPMGVSLGYHGTTQICDCHVMLL